MKMKFFSEVFLKCFFLLFLIYVTDKSTKTLFGRDGGGVRILETHLKLRVQPH